MCVCCLCALFNNVLSLLCVSRCCCLWVGVVAACYDVKRYVNDLFVLIVCIVLLFMVCANCLLLCVWWLLLPFLSVVCLLFVYVFLLGGGVASIAYVVCVLVRFCLFD